MRKKAKMRKTERLRRGGWERRRRNGRKER